MFELRANLRGIFLALGTVLMVSCVKPYDNVGVRDTADSAGLDYQSDHLGADASTDGLTGADLLDASDLLDIMATELPSELAELLDTMDIPDDADGDADAAEIADTTDQKDAGDLLSDGDLPDGDLLSDGDGLDLDEVGECDDGKWEDGNCVPLPYCGDGFCNGDETCESCDPDCGCQGNTVCWDNQCCTPVCGGKECGDDGCGGTCGTCGGHFECENALCVYIPWCGDSVCNSDLTENCNTCPGDCGCTTCGEICVQGACQYTACDGKQCGDDGCGGTCGTCTGLQDECIEGACICQPACDGKQCGNDGCGSICGNCASGQTCKTGLCVTTGFVLIPTGSFWMGSPDGTCPTGYTGSCTSELGRSSEPLTYVQLTRSFEMQAREVTQGEWKARFGGTNPSYFPSCGDSCPVEYVTWFSVLEYANSLSTSKGYPSCYTITGCSSGTAAAGTLDGCTVTVTGSGGNPCNCTGYRMPTEAEWEYAYRSGSTTAFYPSSGNNGSITQTGTNPLDPNLDKIGWYGGNSSSKTWPVGGKAPNAWGLYDMSGNVREWVWDWYASYPSGSVSTPLVDPLGGGSGSDRVGRGGSWSNDAQYCRAANRSSNTPGYRNRNLGFRVARTLVP